MCLEITLLKSPPHLPGANLLMKSYDKPFDITETQHGEAISQGWRLLKFHSLISLLAVFLIMQNNLVELLNHIHIL